MKPYKIINSWVNEHIHAEQAVTADTSAVMSLLRDTAIWLQSKGSTQWSQLLEGHDVHGMADSIQNGDVFLFKQKDSDTLAAVVMLLQQPSAWDRELWDDATVVEDAIYLHRLALNRSEAGSGLGSKVMRWVENNISFPGKSRIRLDCIVGNEKLYHLYSQLGYVHQGIHTSGFHCFEKLLAVHDES